MKRFIKYFIRYIAARIAALANVDAEELEEAKNNNFPRFLMVRENRQMWIDAAKKARQSKTLSY